MSAADGGGAAGGVVGIGAGVAGAAGWPPASVGGAVGAAGGGTLYRSSVALAREMRMRVVLGEAPRAIAMASRIRRSGLFRP